MEFGVGRKVATLTLAGVLGTAGCGSAIRSNVFPDMDCGANPGGTRKATYYVVPGEGILLGHAFGDDGGIETDATVKVNAEGRLVATDNERSESEEDNPQITATEIGTRVTSGNEEFVVTAVPEADGQFAVTVAGACLFGRRSGANDDAFGSYCGGQ